MTNLFETIGVYRSGHVTQIGEHATVDDAVRFGEQSLSGDYDLKEVDVCPLVEDAGVQDSIRTLSR